MVFFLSFQGSVSALQALLWELTASLHDLPRQDLLPADSKTFPLHTTSQYPKLSCTSF